MDQDDPRASLIGTLADLRAYARFLAPQRAEADDLVQEALTRALSAMPQFRPGTNMRAWAFVILRNVFYEQVRRRRTERRVMALAPPPEEARRPQQDAQTDLADLQHHLFSLPPLLREALVLVGAQGMSYQEAAQICSVPAGTMKARVSRARTMLTDAMRTASAHPSDAAAPTAP